jgi:hypothetical protein
LLVGEETANDGGRKDRSRRDAVGWGIHGWYDCGEIKKKKMRMEHAYRGIARHER